MTNATLADTLRAGINNPDCSFFVGGMMGGIYVIRLMALFFISLIVFKLIDRLIIDPILNFIRRGKNDIRQTHRKKN